jgi:SAM-dependent methyltransferase
MLPEMPGERRSGEAAEAYDRMAPIYDEFNKQNDYEHWLGEVLLPELEKHGLRRGWAAPRVLDIGCGTGRAFAPLLSRGWRITGCDLSEEMIGKARGKFGASTAELLQADARDLPVFHAAFHGAGFDLILALNDVVNYLTEDGDLELFLEGVRRNLAPHGLVCFDANTLSLFEANWVAGRQTPMSERGWFWSGLSEGVEAGGTFEAEMSGKGIESHRHRQRHWTREQVEGAMSSCGLRRVAVQGMTEDGGRVVLEDPPDEYRHYKTIYITGLRD